MGQLLVVVLLVPIDKTHNSCFLRHLYNKIDSYSPYFEYLSEIEGEKTHETIKNMCNGIQAWVDWVDRCEKTRKNRKNPKFAIHLLPEEKYIHGLIN